LWIIYHFILKSICLFKQLTDKNRIELAYRSKSFLFKLYVKKINHKEKL